MNVIVVPHQRPPYLDDPISNPPDADDWDRLVGGDHDAHASLSMDDARTYVAKKRHQYLAVAALLVKLDEEGE